MENEIKMIYKDVVFVTNNPKQAIELYKGMSGESNVISESTPRFKKLRKNSWTRKELGIVLSNMDLGVDAIRGNKELLRNHSAHAISIFASNVKNKKYKCVSKEFAPIIENYFEKIEEAKNSKK